MGQLELDMGSLDDVSVSYVRSPQLTVVSWLLKTVTLPPESEVVRRSLSPAAQLAMTSLRHNDDVGPLPEFVLEIDSREGLTVDDQAERIRETPRT